MGLALSLADAAVPAPKLGALYGMNGGFKAKPGQRAALAAVLLEGIEAMPGCLHYVVAEDLGDADVLWISEVWDSKASHDASLALPAVRAAIAKGRPMIAGFVPGPETRVLGGIGLPRR